MWVMTRPKGSGREFIRGENLHGVDLKAATDQRIESGFVTGRIKEISKHHGHAGLSRF